LTKVSRLTVDFRSTPFNSPSMVSVTDPGPYAANFGVISQIEASSDGAGHAWVDLYIVAPSGAETAGVMTVSYRGQSITSAEVVAVPTSGNSPGGSSVALVNLGTMDYVAPP